MMYDAEGDQEDYDECWNELINHSITAIKYQDIILRPQGVAAAVKLTEDVKEWFQDPKSSPHVTLLVAEEYQSQEIGPMIKEAQQVREWIPTDSPYVHASPDKKFLRISYTQADEVIAEKVLLSMEIETQMMMEKSHKDLLSHIPPQLWPAC